MCLLFSFIPASIFTTIGYFVLLTARKQDSQGMHLFGRILAIVLFVIATGFIACGLYVTVTGQCPMERFF